MRGELSEYTAGGEGTFDRYRGGELLIATYRTVHWRKLKLKPPADCKARGVVVPAMSNTSALNGNGPEYRLQSPIII